MRHAWLLAVGTVVTPLNAQQEAAPQVYLLTMGVGGEIAARFGHNAILIRDTTTQSELVYNFGTFAESAKGFIVNFVMGRPQYWLDVETLDRVLKSYTYQQRSIVAQELNLTAPQRIEIAARLAENAKPEHRTYTYDYYRDNCSTRVRDLLDLILDGALKQATTGIPADGNLRSHTQRSDADNPFLYLGIMTLMGPSTDQPLDQWDEMFLPEKLHARVGQLRIPGVDGAPESLVKREFTLLDINVFEVLPAPPRWALRFLGIGSALGLLILTGRIVGGVGAFGRMLARLWLVIIGAGGLLLLFVWFGTNHVAAANNRNVLLLSPLALLLIGQVNSGPRSTKANRFVRFAFTGSILVGTLLALVPSMGGQWNLQLAALVVPPSIATLFLIASRPASAHRSLHESPAHS